MTSAKHLLREIAWSLREVIAPATTEPYAKSQAYMAAVILDFVSRQIMERGDIAESKRGYLRILYDDLAGMSGVGDLVGKEEPSEANLSKIIEQLYSRRERMDEEAFAAANRRIRETLRELLNEELKVAGAGER
jgi:hypothetical protein